ncbi:MAG: hypothetical protein AVDCRST_MAG33-213, partial [uncultured Thermomicrobiales bacterium]
CSAACRVFRRPTGTPGRAWRPGAAPPRPGRIREPCPI